MRSSQEESAAYVLGHSERELARLERQAGFFADMTREVLVRAGIGEGMRVLDVGCGVGDVTSIAADLVGPKGAVHGIDISADALAIAGNRMRAFGKSWVSFATTPIEAFEDVGSYDAIIGRFILIHIADPAALLRSLVGRARPGATVAFMEMDLSTAAAIPPLPLLQTNMERIIEVYRRAGRQMDMGSKLFATFRDAGLDPKLAGFTRVSSSAEAAGYEFVTESVRSMLPFMAKLGIASPEDVGIDTLHDRLREEGGAGEHCIFYPRFIGAWSTASTLAVS